MLLICYLATMAPGVTFWDAGEFIAAAHGFGIPHPPGTPLYVALGHVWVLAFAPLLGSARAMNLLSATCTALAGALIASVIARQIRTRDAVWGALAGVLCAGLMTSVWANATETEVYAIALLHVALLLVCAARAGDESDAAAERWVLVTAYGIALAPAVHLSALVGVPAAIALAARTRDGAWRLDRVLLLGGVLVATAGVGRMSPWLVAAGLLGVVASASFIARGTRRFARVTTPLMALLLAALAYSALLVLLLRARHDPPLNQGNPSTFGTLAYVVARRQYDVAGLLPRQAPVWLQLANVAQYVDWQIALDWGRGIFTTPARVLAALAFVALAVTGARAMRRDDRRLADAMLVLLLCGTLGVAAYLNLKAGASLGWGVLPDSTPHEARERDYFFVLGFWAWGCLAGYGALSLARRRGKPWLALVACLVPLVGNWRGADRSRGAEATAAHDVARGLLAAAPANAVLFTGGDNDSYPLWYAQQVEGVRRDVLLVTLSLLPADWYPNEIARRTGWRLRLDEPVAGASWSSQQRSALVARAARAAGRPIAATPLVTAAERSFLGSRWRLTGYDFVADQSATGRIEPATIDQAAALRWIGDSASAAGPSDAKVDDVAAVMLRLLECPRLALGAARTRARADSLEVKCNLQ